MPASAQQCEETAIAAIDSFLETTRNDLLGSSGDQLRKLAARIHAARVARMRSDPPSSDAYIQQLHTRYCKALEDLRDRLAELQQKLVGERDSTLQQQARMARTRQWHDSLSSTQ